MPEPAAAERRSRVSGRARSRAPGTMPGASLPVMPGFREMALRRSADEQAARMAGERGRLVRELAEQRQAAGLSQTEIAARMGTSQSAVARLESGTADVARLDAGALRGRGRRPDHLEAQPSRRKEPANDVTEGADSARNSTQRRRIRSRARTYPDPAAGRAGLAVQAAVPPIPDTAHAGRPGLPSAPPQLPVRCRRPGCGSTRTPTGRASCTSGCWPSGSCWPRACSMTTRPPGSRPSSSPWMPSRRTRSVWSCRTCGPNCPPSSPSWASSTCCGCRCTPA